MPAGDDLRVLHLFGSRASDFYAELSCMYAEQVLAPPGVAAVFASVAPDGAWRFGARPDAISGPLPLAEALRRMPAVDLAAPHMFCVEGMTTYRALFEDLLGIPVVGSDAATTTLATRKSWTRDVLAAAGLATPRGELVARGAAPAVAPPVVVKPNREDNSRGVSVARTAAEVAAAVDAARAFDEEVIAEEFIPGRELRVAAIELEGDLLTPAFIEYPTSAARPIREAADKLETGADGLRLSRRADAQPVCPANVSPDLAARLRDVARRAHRAIGARDYSLFDVRVHASTGEPYILEAGLFWTFSELSAITRMLRGAGRDPAEITGRLWRAAAARGVPRGVGRAA